MALPATQDELFTLLDNTQSRVDIDQTRKTQIKQAFVDDFKSRGNVIDFNSVKQPQSTGQAPATLLGKPAVGGVAKFMDKMNKPLISEEGIKANIEAAPGGFTERAVDRGRDIQKFAEQEAAGEIGKGRQIYKSLGTGAGQVADTVFTGIGKAIGFLDPLDTVEDFGKSVLETDTVKSGLKYIAEQANKGLEITGDALYKVPGIKQLTDQYDALSPEDKQLVKEDLLATKDMIDGFVAISVVGETAPAVIRTGARLGTGAIETAKPAIQAVKTAAQEGMAIGEVKAAGAAIDELQAMQSKVVGEIIQGKTKDVPKAIDALSSIDTQGVTTYKNLSSKFDENIKSLSSQVDDILAKDTRTLKPKDTTKVTDVGGVKVKQNSVSDALDQLEEVYSKGNKKVELQEIKNLRNQFKTNGLTRQQINEIARMHGIDVKGAFTKLGEPTTSITKLSQENTRKGVKEALRTSALPSEGKATEVLDKAITNNIKARDLVSKMDEKVNVLRQKIQDRSLGAKVGVAFGRAINFLGLGTPKGIIEALIPRGAGFKVMNALDLEKALEKNLKLLQKSFSGKSESQIIKNLNSLSQESKVNLATSNAATTSKSIPTSKILP